MKQMIAALVASTALAAVPAHAQVFNEWDTDNSGMLSVAEFTPGVEKKGWFSDWNANNDKVLNQDEFEAGLFSVFDEDSDGKLTQAEWDGGVDAWFGEKAVDADFNTWDGDGNGMISESEFTEQVGTLDTGFSEVAGDDQEITEDEFDEGLFGWFDDDEDDQLGEEEFADGLFG